MCVQPWPCCCLTEDVTAENKVLVGDHLHGLATPLDVHRAHHISRTQLFTFTFTFTTWHAPNQPTPPLCAMQSARRAVMCKCKYVSGKWAGQGVGW